MYNTIIHELQSFKVFFFGSFLEGLPWALGVAIGDSGKEVMQEHSAWLGILGDLRCEVNACYTVARIGYDGRGLSVQGVRIFLWRVIDHDLINTCVEIRQG